MASILDSIGNTPLVRLQRTCDRGRVFVKLEGQNVGGSVKDRPALQMLRDMLDEERINQDTMLIEPTSGNTGIGLSMVAAALGLKLTIVMPESMSLERRKLIKAYGATLVLTPGPQGMKGAVAEAERLNKEIPNSVIVGQFVNKSNPKAHRLSTGPELVLQCKQYGVVPKYFISGVGTGGTITGCSPSLKSAFTGIRIVALEPKDSPLLQEGRAGPHKIQGIGANFVPEILDKTCYDEIHHAESEDAMQMVRRLARTEGLLVGISGGAAISAAVYYANKHDCDVLCVAPDNGERYLSVEGLFE